MAARKSKRQPSGQAFIPWEGGRRPSDWAADILAERATIADVPERYRATVQNLVDSHLELVECLAWNVICGRHLFERRRLLAQAPRFVREQVQRRALQLWEQRGDPQVGAFRDELRARYSVHANRVECARRYLAGQGLIG